MRSMALSLKKGATFQTAHNKAMKSVGKWNQKNLYMQKLDLND
jgi:hypothetical protein